MVTLAWRLFRGEGREWEGPRALDATENVLYRKFPFRNDWV